MVRVCSGEFFIGDSFERVRNDKMAAAITTAAKMYFFINDSVLRHFNDLRVFILDKSGFSVPVLLDDF